MSSREEWHLSKSVPVTIIFTIVLQLATFVWLISELSTNLENLTLKVQENSNRIQITAQGLQKQGLDSSAMQQELLGISRSLDRLDRGQEKTYELLQELLKTK